LPSATPKAVPPRTRPRGSPKGPPKATTAAKAPFAAEVAKAATIHFAAFKVLSTRDDALDQTLAIAIDATPNSLPSRDMGRPHILCLECFYLVNQ
jgi:hypothetical protein